MSDYSSRFLLACEGLESRAVRPQSNVWWLRLGINLERIKPGHPQQNGRHERLHLTLKQEATKPASYNFLQQQHGLDDFVEVYNTQRPHQALNGHYPAELYTPSPRAYRAPDPPEYPFHDRTVRVTQCGRICIGKRKINLSTVFAGQFVGVKQVADQIWLVSFMDYDLGFFDHETCRLESAGNPFAAKVSANVVSEVIGTFVIGGPMDDLLGLARMLAAHARRMRTSDYTYWKIPKTG